MRPSPVLRNNVVNSQIGLSSAEYTRWAQNIEESREKRSAYGPMSFLHGVVCLV